MWGLLTVAPESCVGLSFHGQWVFIRRIDDEWLFSGAVAHDIAIADSSETEGENVLAGVDVVSPTSGDDIIGELRNIPVEGISQDVSWSRLVSARDETLELMPSLPDRPLVIRPESPVSILPGRYALFFVSIPIWFKFVAVRGKERFDVIDIPSRPLSNTWFGDPGGGELCYSLDAPLMRSAAQLVAHYAHATCNLIVRNGSDENLKFERICVHVENLNVFSSESRLWTNEIRVLFKGTDQVSQISIQKGPPQDVVKPRRLCEPRVPPNRSVIGRSFSFIRQFAGI